MNNDLSLPAIPDRAMVEYAGRTKPLAWLLVKGWLLTLVTLGIYRFWLITDARRYLWSHTNIAGDQLEYTGRGKELLIGFLIALAIVVPLNIIVSLAAFGGEAAELAASSAYVVVLLCLLPFAVYRARRYRLSRTLHRGVRLGLSGSGFSYAARGIGWALVCVLTLGFAYPWMHASLERYVVGNTYYGDKRAHFAGKGLRLALSTLLLQLIVIAPLLASLVLFVTSDGAADLLAGLSSQFEDADNRLPPFSEARSLLGPVVASLGWLTASAVLLYPFYRAIEFRWWTAGIRLDGLSLRSNLGAGQLYLMYLKYWGSMFLVLLAAGIIMFLVLIVIASVNGSLSREELGAMLEGAEAGGQVQWTLTIGVVAAYLVVAAAMGIVYQLVIWAGFWRKAANSITIDNADVLASAGSSRFTSGALGEGIADAFDIGGF